MVDGSGVEGLELMLTKETAKPVQISYSVIESITKNFCQVIGRGGYGIVYLVCYIYIWFFISSVMVNMP